MRILLALLLVFSLRAEEECFKFSLCVDPYFSMRCGSENILSVYNGYVSLDESYLKCYINSVDGVTGGLFRIVDTIALDVPLANLAMVTQHEVFGHGARLRDNYIPAWYHIDFPILYGPGGGYTVFSQGKFDALNIQEQMGVSTGGIEATERLGIDLILDRYCHGSIYVQQYILNLFSYHDSTSYIYSIQEEDDSNDIAAYISELNDYYGRTVLTQSELKNRALINLVDPFFWFTFSAIWDYWVGAKSLTRMPALCFCGFEFTPGLRLNLAPYGLEYRLQTYFKYEGYVGYTYFRYGQTDGKNSYGIGLEIPNVWNYASYYVGFLADIWNQPKLFVNSDQANPTWGARLAVRGHWFFTECSALFLELGGKSRGYLLAEPLQGRLDAKAGFSIIY